MNQSQKKVYVMDDYKIQLTAELKKKTANNQLTRAVVQNVHQKRLCI